MRISIPSMSQIVPQDLDRLRGLAPPTPRVQEPPAPAPVMPDDAGALQALLSAIQSEGEVKEPLPVDPSLTKRETLGPLIALAALSALATNDPNRANAPVSFLESSAAMKAQRAEAETMRRIAASRQKARKAQATTEGAQLKYSASKAEADLIRNIASAKAARAADMEDFLQRISAQAAASAPDRRLSLVGSLSTNLRQVKTPFEYRRIASAINSLAEQYPDELGAFQIGEAEIQAATNEIKDKELQGEAERWAIDTAKMLNSLGLIDEGSADVLGAKRNAILARAELTPEQTAIYRDMFPIITAKSLGQKRLDETIRATLVKEQLESDEFAEVRRRNLVSEALTARRLGTAEGHLRIAERKLNNAEAAAALKEAEKAKKEAEAERKARDRQIELLEKRITGARASLKAAMDIGDEKAQRTLATSLAGMRAERDYLKALSKSAQELEEEANSLARTIGRTLGGMMPQGGTTGSTGVTLNMPPQWKVEN